MTVDRDENRIELVKFHGLGNDFLVLIVDRGNVPGDAVAFARRVCDRHRGVGADGLLCAIRGGRPELWTMKLFNADGSAAEMSGNGIRCFAHAVVRHDGLELPVTLQIATDGGPRRVEVAAAPNGDPNTVVAAVSMGIPHPGPILAAHGRPTTRQVTRATTWDLGNPHLVLEVDDADDVDLSEEGPAWEALFPGGVNVHFVTVTAPDRIRQFTWERGAGITQACGTGATAVALSRFGVQGTPDLVWVDMPGGSVNIELGGDEPILHGPSEWIADLSVCP